MRICLLTLSVARLPSKAKGVAALSGSNGKCREHLRVYHKEKKLETKSLPVIAIPTSASVGSYLSPQSLVLYEPEEALVPIYAEDLSPEVRSPSSFIHLPPPCPSDTHMRRFCPFLPCRWW